MKHVHLTHFILYRAILNKLYPNEAWSLGYLIAYILSEYPGYTESLVLAVFNKLVNEGLVEESIETEYQLVEECIKSKLEEQASKPGRRKSPDKIKRECLYEVGYRIKFQASELGLIHYCETQKHNIKAWKLGLIQVSPHVSNIYSICSTYEVAPSTTATEGGSK